MTDLHQQLEALCSPAVVECELELWGLELVRSGGHSLLRVYIERPDMRVTVADCARASKAISAVLDEKDPITENYDLEVSSPGLDRPLYVLSHYARFIGEDVKIETHLPTAGRKRYRGTIVAVNDKIELKVDQQSLFFSIQDVAKARIVPDYTKPSPYQIEPDASVEEESP
jgi:ribosome maturation factor RimP